MSARKRDNASARRVSPARATAIDVLTARRQPNEHVEDRLHEALGASALSRVDRALASEIVLGVTKRRGTLVHLVTAVSGVPKKRVKRPVLVNLEAAFYQVLFLDRVPAFAAIDEAVEIAKRWGPGAARFTNAVMRKLSGMIEPQAAPEWYVGDARTLPVAQGRQVVFRRDVFTDPRENLSEHLAQMWSVPAWLVARWVKAFGGERACRVLQGVNETPPLTIRVDQRVLSVGDVRERLREAGFDCEPMDRDDALRVRRAGDLGGIASGEGIFVQDVASMEAVDALDVVPGCSALDLCAAPGTKTAMIAQRLAPGDRLVAVDVNEARLARVADNLRKARFDGAQLVAMDGRAAPSRVGGGFDRVLVDAPCSNTGVLRRRAEARWHVDARVLADRSALQLGLIAAGFQMLSAGGRMVYSTCSIEHDENEDVVQVFLESHDDARLLAQRLRLPEPGGPDGGYLGAIERVK